MKNVVDKIEKSGKSEEDAKKIFDKWDHVGNYK